MKNKKVVQLRGVPRFTINYDAFCYEQSLSLTPLLSLFYWWKVCVCTYRTRQEKKTWRREKRKGRTERSLPLQQACLSSPLLPLAESECERKKKEKKERKRIWGIRGPDWVSNKYSGEQSVLTLFPSRPVKAVKESDNFAAQWGQNERMKEKRVRVGERESCMRRKKGGRLSRWVLFQGRCWSWHAPQSFWPQCHDLFFLYLLL